MKNSNLRLALQSEHHALTPPATQQQLEKLLGLAQSTLSQYLSGRRVPELASLRALATRWPSRAAGLRILIGYLRDVVEQAGRPDEITIAPRDAAAAPLDEAIAADMATLRVESAGDPETAQLLHRLAELVRSSYILRPARAPDLRVAEPPAEYGEKKLNIDPPQKPPCHRRKPGRKKD